MSLNVTPLVVNETKTQFTASVWVDRLPVSESFIRLQLDVKDTEITALNPG